MAQVRITLSRENGHVPNRIPETETSDREPEGRHPQAVEVGVHPGVIAVAEGVRFEPGEAARDPAQSRRFQRFHLAAIPLQPRRRYNEWDGFLSHSTEATNLMRRDKPLTTLDILQSVGA